MISPFSLLKCLLFILSLSLYQVISGLGKPTDSQEKDTLLPSFAVKLDGGFLVILGTSKWINDQENVVRKTERAYLPSVFNSFAALLHWTPLKNQCDKLWFHGLITFKIRFHWETIEAVWLRYLPEIVSQNFCFPPSSLSPISASPTLFVSFHRLCLRYWRSGKSLWACESTILDWEITRCFLLT